MKRIISILVIMVCAGSLWAASSGETLRSLYDVVAPVLAGNPAAADRQVGQIFYDTTAAAFKGVNSTGGIDRLSNAGGGTPLSLVKTSVHNASEDDLVFDANNTSPIIFRLETYDANDIYNQSTGVFTAPANGQYTFTAKIFSPAVNVAEGGTVSIEIGVNSALPNAGSLNASQKIPANSKSFELDVNADINLLAGDTVNLSFTSSPPFGGTFVPPTAFGGWASFKQIP